MKKKILLYYIILIVIGVSITGLFTSRLAQMFYKQEVEEKLKNTAILINYQLSGELEKGNAVDYNLEAEKYARALSRAPKADTSEDKYKTRVTFIDNNGKVVGESETDMQSMENHLNRKEVQEALKGGIGMDTRFSKTLKVNSLYVALPLDGAKVIVRVSVPLVQVEIIDRTIWFFTAIGILSGLLMTTLLAFRFSNSITRPVNELIHVSEEIALGNYSRRVQATSRDELGQLADAFNKMVWRLEKTVADLMDKNIKVDSIINSMTNGMVAVDPNYKIIMINPVVREIFGIRNGPGAIGMNILELIRNNQINSLLKETIEKNVSLIKEITLPAVDDMILRVNTTPIKSMDAGSPNSGGIIFIQDITNMRKLEQIRTEFVSNVTHELKTPLTSIRGFIETLRGGAIHDQDVSEKFLEIIDIEAERLYLLINDILQLSEIESKQKDINIGTHNLKAIVDEIAPLLQETADKKCVSLKFDINENSVVTANRDRIKQLFINLVDNAIKYNVENGRVDVRAFENEGEVNILVKDTGIGIAKEHLPRIFERFYRVDKGRSRNMGGTGLGLSIVKHIVILYGGEIKVNSEPGKGTGFIVRLPVK